MLLRIEIWLHSTLQQICMVPLNFPPVFKLIAITSPYYWIGVSRLYHFQKPIQVELEHFAACDPSYYQLLCCEDDDESYTMQPVNQDLIFKILGKTSLCIFQTSHFCSYYLFHNCKNKGHNTINRVATLYLKPENFQYLDEFSVEIWFSFPVSHCLKRNKELFKKEHMTLDTHCMQSRF